MTSPHIGRPGLMVTSRCVERTRRLACGETLTEITSDIAQRLGVASHVTPMSDEDPSLRD